MGGTTENTNDGTGSKVYFTKEITPESLVSIYKALDVSAEGKRVAVKISTGESSRTHYLRPEFIKNLHGTHPVEYAEQLGLGSQHYTLIDLGQMSGIKGAKQESVARYNVYSLDGKRLLTNVTSLEGLQRGTYIVNGEKRIIE